MARMGKRLQQPRLSAPRAWPIKRKRGGHWITNVIPGPHPKSRSIPLLVLIRDVLGLAETRREARRVIKEGRVLVDGRVVKEPRFPIGLFDVVEIPEIGKAYRILLDSHGRISVKEINGEEKGYKLCRVERKVMVRGGRLQLGFHDGRTILVDPKTEIKTGDVVKMGVPNQEILQIFPLAPGSLVYILSGRHAGKIGKVEEVIPGSLRRKPAVRISVEGEELETVKANVFVVGTERPEVSV